MSLKIVRPGLLTHLQDAGRFGYQKYGVIVSGVMDLLSSRLANVLVGNEENDATMEITLLGPVIEFESDTLFALCGGNLSPTIIGTPVPMWRPVLAAKGTQLRFGSCVEGCRVYMAVAGGFEVPQMMASKSTYLRGGIGGYQGRALAAGDVLIYGQMSEQGKRMQKQLSAGPSPFAACEWMISSEVLPVYQANPTIRAMRGKEFSWFTEDSQRRLFSQEFVVTPQSDRMGYRLQGERLEMKEPKELLSEAVAFGTVQVPSEGNPIVLLADRQTTGGYPKIAQIATVDLPLMAQIKPGDRIYFQEISHQKAQQLYLLREKQIKQLKWGISLMGR